jgi:phosphate starvation-inducible protein PhoH and related proteins
LSKRKTGALRKKEPRFTMNNFSDYDDSRTFYIKERKTNDNTVINFNQHQNQRNKKAIELVPKSINQETYILALTDPSIDVVVASGPAGTGKTYLAVLAALQSLRDRSCDKIVITRPAVSVDNEQHGFLPGDLNQKMEPWVKPIYDVINEFYSTKELQYMIEEGIIEIAPLGFCRGRTFKNSWIIVDESQNAIPGQLKMLLTRIGEGSKIIITGDTEQTDRKAPENGLLDLVSRFSHYPVPGMTACAFDKRDIRRHKIIEHILKMYS